MSENKGKGRAKSDDHEAPSKVNESSQNPSLLSRVAASAEGLTRSILTPPNNAEVNATVTSTLLGSGKAQPVGSTSSSATFAETSKSPLPSSTQQLFAGGSSSFRASHHDEHVQQSEAEFSKFLDGIDSFESSKSSRREFEAGADNFEGVWSRSRSFHATNPAGRTVAEQELHDGEDVLALLSVPTDLENEPHESDREEVEDYDWGLSSEQLTQLRAITKELFPPPEPHGSVSVDNPLNLIPQDDLSANLQLTGHSNIHTLDQWAEQWGSVLTRYTDEVWGGLLPLVKEARQEAEDMRESGTEQIQPKALRRLEAILGHLQRR